MSRMVRFRRGIGFRASALLRRLLLVALLLTGLDLVHDGRVGWPGILAPGVLASLHDAGASAQGWLQRSPALCTACGGEVVAEAPVTPRSRPSAALPERDAAPASGAAGSAADTSPADEPAVEADLAGRVARVIDGDSLQVRVRGLGVIEVRLHGVDTPEWDQPYGRAARRELRRLVARQRVDLVSETTDSYGRLVATVYRGDLNVNREMVRRGYAWWYRRYAGLDFALRRAEKEARAQRRGLWRDDDPVPPWDWRRK